MKKRYRIVSDCLLGCKIEEWVWYFPFWVDTNIPVGNTFKCVKDAENAIIKKQKHEVYAKMTYHNGELKHE